MNCFNKNPNRNKKHFGGQGGREGGGDWSK